MEPMIVGNVCIGAMINCFKEARENTVLTIQRQNALKRRVQKEAERALKG